jgi:hypothetical protein
MTGEQVPERIRWAVRTMAPGPDDHLLEIGAPARELDLIRAVLKPGGTLFLFYGYGTPGRDEPRVPEALFDHLTDGGFTAESRTAPSVLGVAARPVRSRRR